MRPHIHLPSFAALLWLLLATVPTAPADVAPGDVIDKTNWEKAKGLVPDNTLEWLKRGDFTLEVADLNFDPTDYVPAVVKTSLQANKGKYDVDEDGLMVDVATGKLPEFIEGIPFPEIDPNDPKAGSKIMYNKFYQSYSLGHVNYPFSARWVGRNTGFEREVICDYKQYPMDGAPGARKERNSERLERMALILVLAPFDIKGTNILNWRYRDKRQDSTFGYVPAIRRVRRMSPANRSDAFIGADICVDDAWVFDGKTNSMEWKFLGKREALVPFLTPEFQRYEITRKGGWRTSKSGKIPKYGYEDDQWQGAPWMPTNLIWAKRQVYVVQLTPKDPYYNYGVQEIWIDAEVQIIAVWKVINDRAGKYWKTEWQSWTGFQGPEEEQKAIVGATMMAIDDRTDHCSIIRLFTDEYQVTYYDSFDRNDFTMAGFQKFCK